MKKIVFIINSFKKGGPVNMLYNLVKYINSNEWAITVIALNKCCNNNRKNFNELNCDVIELETKKNFNKTKKEIIRIIEKINPDIIHSHGGNADYFCSKFNNKYITFSTVHCVPHEDFIFKKGKLLGSLKTHILYNQMKKIKYPIACSRTVSDKINKYTHAKLEYVQNGIDFNKIEKYKKYDEMKISTGENEKIIFVFCGFLSKGKNVSFLIEAFSTVKRDDIELIILGDGVQYQNLLEKCKSDKRISMVGRVGDPIPYLLKAHYFISASLSEGLPLAVMEGMACGLPPILSDIDAHRELYEINPTVVTLFDLENIGSLVNILNESSLKEYNNFSNLTEKIIKEEINANIMSKKYQNLYMKSLM